MKNKFLRLAVLFFLMAGSGAYGQIITTVAGTGTAGYNGDDIPATTAKLANPIGVAVDGSGNIYICEGNHIRKVDPLGIIRIIAGTGSAGFSGDNGPATAAELNAPIGVALDKSGNIYFSDVYNQRVRKVSASGIITTIAGTGTAGYNGDNGAATLEELNYPHGVAVDNSGNVYVADNTNNRIRKISSSGIMTSYVGTGIGAFSGDNGSATTAEIFHPYGIALDGSGNLYIADLSNGRLRKVNTSGIITTIAGNGTPGSPANNGPATAVGIEAVCVTIDGAGNIYLGEAGIDIVRKIDAFGNIATIAGIDGLDGYNGDGIPATDAKLFNPTGLALDGSGSLLYIADFGNNRIRYIRNTLLVNAINTSGNFKVYPNPSSSGQLTFNASSGNDDQLSITITNAMGETIKEITARTNRPVEVQLDMPAGVYFLSAVTANGRWNQKVVVNR